MSRFTDTLEQLVGLRVRRSLDKQNARVSPNEFIFLVDLELDKIAKKIVDKHFKER